MHRADRWKAQSATSPEREPASAGRSALLAKLAEALFIETLRRYMAELPRQRTGWLAGARDSAVGRALGAIHREPARAWTVASLAQQAGECYAPYLQNGLPGCSARLHSAISRAAACSSAPGLLENN